MDNINTVKQELDSLAAEEAKLRSRRLEVAKDLRLKCPHENLVECDYILSHFSSLPPIRLCIDCGVSENGWGAGYQVLTHRNEYGHNSNPKAPKRHLAKVSREAIFSLAPAGGAERWGWCYGNRYFRPHAVPYSDLKAADGTRCCYEHAGDYAHVMRCLETLATFDSPVSSKALASRMSQGSDLARSLASRGIYASCHQELERLEKAHLVKTGPKRQKWQVTEKGFKELAKLVK